MSRIFAFSDGLSSGELAGHARGARRRVDGAFKDADGLPLELIASRLPDEEAFYREDAGAGLVDHRDDVLGARSSRRA